MRFIHLVLFAAAAALVSPAVAGPLPAARGGVAVAPVIPGVPRIFFAGRPLPVPDSALTPYRDPSDNALCAAPESLTSLGVSCIVDGRAQTASLTGPEGKSTTVRARKAPNGRVFVPVIEVMEALGGKCEWQPSTNTVHIRATLTSVEMLGGQLRIKATLPVTATVVNRKDPAQIIVDVAGAEIGKLPRKVPLFESGIVARTGQFKEDTARIVLDLKEPSALAPASQQPSTLLILNPVPTSAAPRAPIVIKIPPDPAPAVTPAPKPPAPPAFSPTVVSAISFRPVSDKQAQILVSAGRAPQVRSTLVPGQLILEMPNARLDPDAEKALDDIKHPLVHAVQVVAAGENTARVIVDLNRVVAYSISPGTRPAGLVIDLSLPRGAGGKLAGKLIVVDPGHGGSDPGAYGVGGRREKNVNLAVGLALRDKLRDAGANVVVTRSDDVFIALSERARIANRAGADFFISVHSDSAGRNRSIHGSTVYHHKQVPSCRALAHCIAQRLGAMGGISTKGVRSDQVIAPKSGFAVLRHTRMVGVLVECGYMTNPGDEARLVQPAMQRRIAQAVVDGLRDYIEGNPDQSTKDIKPGLSAEDAQFPGAPVAGSLDPGVGESAAAPGELPMAAASH